MKNIHLIKKKETLEEFAQNYAIKTGNHNDKNIIIDAVKWWQEQNKKFYNEEEVIQIQKEWRNFDDTQDSFNGQDDLTFKEWFEQFKK